MNPAHFPNPGGAMPGVVKPGMQPPPKNENAQVIMNHVAQVLSSQGPYVGWKTEVPIKTRAMNVYQMITSLRLIQPRIDLNQAAQAALSFEHKAFQKATERNDYDKECTEKLLHIKDTRQRQAAVAYQSGIMPQAGAVPNQIQGGFPQQMNRNLQTSPVPGQPQMAMGMNDPNQQAAMQQRQQQSMLQQQRAQQRPGNGVPLPDDLNTLSAQDLDHVSRLASSMLAKTSPEDMEKIKMNLSNMTPEQRQYLARKNMEPMTYFFRSQALNQLRRHRRARMEMGGAPNAGVDPNGTMMGDPMMNPQQHQVFQNMMNLQRNSAFSGNPGQNLETAFIGNVENIQGQQADGLRSQEAGQLVVPASSSQMNQQPYPNGQNVFPQQMGQNGQANMNGAGVNPQMFNQQHLQSGSNVPQDRMQFQTQQSQAAQAQARSQAAQKAQMAMSGHGGQVNQTQPRLTQQSPVMPMLNQPMAPGQMSPAQVPGTSRPPSRPPNMGQHPAGLQGVSQPGVPGRPQIPQGLPQSVQEQLSRMSNEQLQAFLMNQRRAALANNMARANAAQQPASMQQNPSQPGQGQAMLNGQMANNPRMRNSMSLPQGMTAGAPPQGQPLNGQQLTPQQRQQRQNEFYKLQLLRQHNNGMEMTPEQGRDMDRMAFPPSILNSNPSSVPKHIKTWGQLKQWAAQNPQLSNGVDLPKLMTLQKLHLAQILTAQSKAIGGQGPGISPPTGPQGQMANTQGFPTGQPQPPVNMPVMRPITAQDIQMARQKLGPQSPNFTDDQIREILHRNRQKNLMQAAQNRAAHLDGNLQPTQQNQPAPQPPVSAPQPGPQTQPGAPSQEPQLPAGPQASNAKPQVGAAPKGGKAAPGKQASKKRPHADETGETRATTTPQQTQPTAVPGAPTTAPPRPALPFSQEQLAAMSPQQRQAVEAHIRKQQGQARGPVISRAAAEDAWNRNLPPQVMEVYNDISKNAPLAQPIPVSPEQKAAMAQQLREALDLLGRLDVLVQWFAKVQGQEKNVRNLLAMRIQLMQQFKPSPEWIVKDHFTVSSDYLSGAILFIRRLFQLMIGRMSQQQNHRPNASQAPVPAAQTTQASMPALNATNLQQLQQQEEALQRARRASSQSAAAVAPAPFGAPSPQGVPHAYGPGGLAPEKLKLPPPKKRKQSHAGPGASPVQASAAPATAARYKQATNEAKATAAALAGAFKCGVVECQHHYQGFPTQAALDRHVEDSHQLEEEIIEDPLQYYLDSISIGLGLTSDTSTAKQAATSGPAPSKLGPVASPAKQGMPTPATTNTTMARVASQLGTKSASPAVSAQQLTPRQPSSKGIQPSPSKDVKKETDKSELPGSEVKDPWADCPMSLELLHDTFSPILGRDPTFDLMDDFFMQQTDQFLQEQGKDTPDSVDLALATKTPEQDSKEAVIVDDFLLPWDEEAAAETAAWMAIPPEIQNNSDGEIHGVRVDWDLLERQQKELNLDSGVPVIPAL